MLRAPVRDFARRSALLVVPAVILGAAILLSQTPAHSQNTVGARYEYGELRLIGNDAVFFNADDAFYMEGPDDRTPRRLSGEGRDISVVQPILVIHLNQLGPAGWEVVEFSGGSDRILLRRRVQ